MHCLAEKQDTLVLHSILSNRQTLLEESRGLQNEGIADIWKVIEEYLEITKSNNYFSSKRNEQNKYWLIQTIEEQLKSDFFNHPTIKIELQKQLALIEANKTTPFVAAEYLLNLKN